MDGTHFLRSFKRKDCPLSILWVRELPQDIIELNTVETEQARTDCEKERSQILKEFNDVVTNEPPARLPPHR